MPKLFVFCLALSVLLCVGGCGPKADQALESDANGFVCRKCLAKFFTDRELFPDHCPKCKQPDIEQVLGFFCKSDNHATLGSRSRGARTCEKCGRPTDGVSIPKKTELQAWGAVHSSKAEVSGN